MSLDTENKLSTSELDDISGGRGNNGGGTAAGKRTSLERSTQKSSFMHRLKSLFTLRSSKN